MKKIRSARTTAVMVLWLTMTGALAVLMTPYSLAAQTTTPVSAAALTDSLRSFAERLSRFGVSGALLVARNDTVLVQVGMGTASDAGEPLTHDTPFPIASISKTVTAAAILMLEERGSLSLSDSIGRFFPDAPAPMRSVRVEELLTHAGGLPYIEAGAPGMDGAIARALAQPVDVNRRGSFSYSNPGYTILAGIIERASGRSYEDVIRSDIFGPAAMTDSGFLEERDRWAQETRMHSYSGSRDEGSLAQFPPMPAAIGSGSVVSTVGDLYRFVRALRDGRLMSSARAEQLFTRHIDAPAGAGYGYGWNVVQTTRGTRLVHHGGDLGGYNGELRLYVEEGLITIFLSNRRIDGVGYKAAVTNPLALRIAGLPHPAPPALAAEPLDPTAFIAGDYVIADRGVIHLRVDRAQVRVGVSGQETIALFSGAPPELSPHATALNERTQQILAALLAENAQPLQAALTPALPADAMGRMLLHRIGELRSQLGSGAVRAEVLGTTLRAPNAGTTAFTLHFATGEQAGQIGWAGGHILDVDLDRTLPLEARIARSVDGGIVAYDPFTGATTWLGASRRANGDVLLRIRNGAGQTGVAVLTSAERAE